MKKFIAWLLSAAMLLGLCGAALAAPAQETGEKGSLAQASVSAQAETEQRALLGQRLAKRTVRSLQKDEKVRAIVLMESEPLTETQYTVSSAEGVAYTARLQREQDAVYAAMRAKKVAFEVVYTFDTLLNGFSCDVAYGDLAAIAALPGVKSVHIARQYSIPTPQEPNTTESGAMTGNAASIAGGNDGQGTVVAVLDSGVNLEHIAFQDYGNLGNVKLTKANISKVTTPGQYVNAKVPFAYDYADKDNDPTDDGEDTGGHGTHVAGIAVGYAVDEEDQVVFSGAAPAAQLLAMKIFGTKEATTTSDIYFKALEDALKLGADVINMSIGSDNGFVYDDSLDTELGDIYDRLEEAGVVVCVSAGNSNTMGQYSTKGYISSDYADYGVVGSPATYSSNVAVASVDNAKYPVQYIKIGGQSSDVKTTYIDSSDDARWDATFGNKEVEYVLITDAEGALSLGTKADFDRIVNPAPAPDPAPDPEPDPEPAPDPDPDPEAGTDSAAADLLADGDTDPVDPGTGTDPVDPGTGTDPVDPGTGSDSVDPGTEPEDPDEPTAPVSPLKGKIAVVSRGSINFTEKEANAYAAGAAGLLVINNADDGDLRMQLNGLLPAISMPLAAKDAVMSATNKVLYTDTTPVWIASETAGQISDFSSWGPTPNLTMRPTLTSVGGNIWSADWKDNEGYQLMSGTSMSSPNLAGTFANVLQYLYKSDRTLRKYDAAAAAKSLMESTAQLIEDPNGRLYSVRAQGAGLGCSDLAQAAWEAGYVVDPIQDGLGDSLTGNYSFTVTLKNNSDAAITYKPSAVVMTDTSEDVYYEDDASDPDNYMYTQVTFQSTYLYDDREGTDAEGGATVTYSDDSVTVPAGGTADVTVTIALTEDGLAYFEENGFVNGSYVEGYVFFTDTAATDAAPTIHASFLGFCGDWAQAPSMEPCDFQDYLDAEYFINTTVANEETGETYAELGATPYDFLDVTTIYNDAWVIDSRMYGHTLGSSTLSGYDASLMGTIRYAPYDESHNMLSTNVEATGGYVYLFANPALIRNAKLVDMVVTDEETGKVYYRALDHLEEENDDVNLYIPKGMYDANNQVWEQYTYLFWDGTGPNGQPLPDGTTVRVTFDVTLPYGNAVQENAWSTLTLAGFDEETGAPIYYERPGFVVTMDSTAPEVVDAHFVVETEETEEAEEEPEELCYIEMTVDEANLDSVYLAYGEDIIDYFLYDDPETADMWTVNEDGTVNFRLEVMPEDVDFYGALYVGVVDYAGNESGADVPLSESVGEVATVTLHTPKGAVREKVTTGEFYELPDCDVVTTEGENAEFAFWYPEALDGEIPEEDPDEIIDTEKILLPGDQKMITGDAEFYAIYLKGEKTVPEFPHYVLEPELDDYSGTWIFAGYDISEDYRYLLDNPLVLNQSGETVSLPELDPDVVLADGDFLETANETVALTVERQADGSYTIQGADGKYLSYAYDEVSEVDKPVMSDTPVKWSISVNDNNHFIVSPVADPELVLLYDWNWDSEFVLFDNTVAMTQSGAVAADMFSLFPYQHVEYVLADAVYTTSLKAKSSGSTGGTVTAPADQTEVKENEDGSTTTTVTTPEGDKTITVTDKDGETVAEVTIPAAIPAPETRFEDVPEGHWADEGIHNMAALKAVNGVGNNQFDMNSGMTRGDLATILHRLSNKPAGGEVSFEDVDNDKYYAAGIAWAAKTGVVTGFSKDTYKPEQVITREQMALMLMRYAKLLGMDTTADAAELDVFADGANTHDWAVEGVAWCVKSGILQGKGGAALDPTSNVTRAQVAVMLDRFVALMK